MDRTVIKQVVLEQENSNKVADTGIQREQLRVVDSLVPLSHAIIICGIRRCGKSTLMRQILKKYYESAFYFVDFEDERFVKFTTEDFNSLYEILIELYGLNRVFFLMKFKILKTGNFSCAVYIRRKIKSLSQDLMLLC